jgi:hypothetical protein
VSAARRGRAAAVRRLRAGQRRFQEDRNKVLRRQFVGVAWGRACLAGDRWTVTAGGGRLVLEQSDPDVLVPLLEYGRWIFAHPLPLSARQRAKVVRRGR